MATKDLFHGLDLNSNEVTGLPAPSAASDAATKQYVDDAIVGLRWKEPVRAATTAAGTLATDFEDGDTIDGVLLATGDRLLIKNQAAADENGIYVVAASGAPARAADFNSTADANGAAVFVLEGTTNENTGWTQTADDPVIDTDALTFAQFTGGQTYTAGDGLALDGTEFNVGEGAGIDVTADAVAVDFTVVPHYAVFLIGDGAATTFDLAHNFGQQWVVVKVIEVASEQEVGVVYQCTDANNVRVIFEGITPANNTYRVVVVG